MHEPPIRPRQRPGLLIAMLAGVGLLLAWSGYRPYEMLTWVLEVSPAVVAIIVLLATRKRFPFSTLAYALIAVHAVILIIGGHYTYARVPLGEWFRDTFELSRNHYDRLGHFAQGFVPAIVTREVLIRTSPLNHSRWLGFLVVCVCTAISAVYELVEWGVAELDEAGSAAFLGTQGDIWDTQKDMALCLIGATVAVITLARAHDQSMGRARS
jgi:putative membrane protein